MSLAAHMIPVTRKASNVCVYCRVRKQRCDRMLPRCERCAAKNRECDYTPPLQQGAHEPEPFVVYHEACGHADLSPQGATELRQAVKVCIDAPSNPDGVANLLELVSEMLNSADFSLSKALTAFGPCIQQWCPIFVEDHLFGCCEYVLSEPVNAQEGPANPLLWMALWLVMRKPCSPHEQMIASAGELYPALKQVHTLLQGAVKPELAVMQIGLLIGVYEFGHGLRKQAFQTLASCAATVMLLEPEARREQDIKTLEVLKWLKASLVMIDRQIPLSMVTDFLPLTVPASHPISKSLREEVLGPVVPPFPPRPYATSPSKVFIRTGAALTAGQVLEHIYDRQQDVEPQKSYDQVDGIVNHCISMLIVKPGSPAMLNCDALPTTFCSHIVFQSTYINYLYNTFPDWSRQENPTPEYLKAIIALKFSRSVAWQLVRVGIQLIKSEESIPRLPLAGVCCVLRGGLAVLETTGFVDDDVIEAGEIDAYVRILKWFSGRWAIGYEYLARVEQVLGRL